MFDGHDVHIPSWMLPRWLRRTPGFIPAHAKRRRTVGGQNGAYAATGKYRAPGAGAVVAEHSAASGRRRDSQDQNAPSGLHQLLSTEERGPTGRPWTIGGDEVQVCGLEQTLIDEALGMSGMGME